MREFYKASIAEVAKRHPHLTVQEHETSFSLVNKKPRRGKEKAFPRWVSSAITIYVPQTWDVNSAGDPVDPMEMLRTHAPLDELFGCENGHTHIEFKECGVLFGQYNDRKNEFGVAAKPQSTDDMFVRVILTDADYLVELRRLLKNSTTATLRETRHDANTGEWFVFISANASQRNPHITDLLDRHEWLRA